MFHCTQLQNAIESLKQLEPQKPHPQGSKCNFKKQGVVTCISHVEAFVTGIKIESSDQSPSWEPSQNQGDLWTVKPSRSRTPCYNLTRAIKRFRVTCFNWQHTSDYYLLKTPRHSQAMLGYEVFLYVLLLQHFLHCVPRFASSFIIWAALLWESESARSRVCQEERRPVAAKWPLQLAGSDMFTST